MHKLLSYLADVGGFFDYNYWLAVDYIAEFLQPNLNTHERKPP